jgi:mono/diheme cytochrome c family protein
MKAGRLLWIAFEVIAGLALVVALAAMAILWNASTKLQRVISLDIAPVAYVSGPESVERGRYLYMARGCAECHGENGEGRVFLDHPNGLFARGANLTTGQGSAVGQYTELDWVRSIRHGVGPDGKPLFPMPSEDYNRFSDKDLADLVAFVRSLPAKDSEGALVKLPLPVKLAYGVGIVKDSAQKIDHTRPPSLAVESGPTIEHGRYVVQVCIGCHGANLTGGRIPGAPPDWPPAANLTLGMGGVMGRYENLDQFKAMMRTGVRPDGSKVDPVMPFQSLKHNSDTDLEALYVFLKTPAANVPAAR